MTRGSGIRPNPAGWQPRRAARWLTRPGAWAAAAAVTLALAGGLVWIAPMAAGVVGTMAAGALFGFGFSVGRTRTLDPVERMLLAAAHGGREARLITREDGSFVYANAAFHRLFALPDGPVDSVAALSDLVGGGGACRHDFARLVDCARTGVVDEAEVPVHMPAGGLEWRRVSVTPVPGTADCALWRAVDIDSERQAAIDADAERARMADFVDNMPAGFFSADAEGRVLYANRTLAGWLGVAVEELCDGQALFADFVVAEESVPVRRAGPGGEHESHGEVTLRARDGDTFRACLAQSEGGGLGRAGAYTRSLVFRDAVWTAGGQDDGPTPAEMLHTLFDGAPVGILMLDLSGQVVECNRTFLKMAGLHRAGVVGRPFRERLVREDREDFEGQLSKLVMGTMPAAKLDVRLPVGEERELAATLHANPVDGGDGSATAILLHVIDATEQKHLEVQFSQSQKMQAVGQLAGGVAHDFNNLLTAMNGFCDLLLTRHPPKDPSHGDIMHIKRNAKRATNLVRQLLAFSRKQRLQPVVLDVNEALSDMSNLLRRLIGETIELRMDLGRDLWPVRADPGQFDQVVINLAVNARDAMARGGALTIRSANVNIPEAMARGHDQVPAGDYVQVMVEDTGTGIAKENIEQIFEPFFSTKEVGAGTGLGLSTVYGIVRQTGGFIFVDSALGEGTTFSLYFPAYAEPQGRPDLDNARLKPPPPSQAWADDVNRADLAGSGTILLVEDEEAVRLFGARALRDKGYTVIEAEHGEAALDRCKEFLDRGDGNGNGGGNGGGIDLIVSDVVMPGMDGHTLIRLVRQEMPGVKVILMSGYDEETVGEAVVEDRTIHFLAKPFSLTDLALKVKEVLAGP
ncbi:MAG: PAS domain-containing protein [Hyphomicrobiales bacterium]|nr:PAS domain-containing protein [Hyphomicrobiales bacterium]MCP5373590.1 PAS domain-containing protein [Hyphomicrobiales bacterium]